MMFKNQYKLHPISAIINFVKGLKDLIIPFLIIFVANGFDVSFNPKEEDFWFEIIPLLIFSVITILYLISGILKWWTFVYWFEDNELRVKYGFFVKKKRFIPFDRIQSFNYKEGIFHRLFGLVQVMVETAGSTDGKPEVILTAITKEAANEIEFLTKKVKRNEFENKQPLFEIAQSEEVVNTPQPKVIHTMTRKDLIMLATTSNSIGVVLAGVVAVISQISEFIPYERIFQELSSFVRFGFVIVSLSIFTALILAWFTSVIITFINYYDFTVVKQDDRLTVTRGLLEKKRVTIPLNRIQAIKILENPLRQMFGLAAVIVESASGGYGEKEKKITLFPLISKRNAYDLLDQILPGFKWEESITRPPKRGKPFFYRINFLWLIPIICLGSYFWFPFGLLSILLIVPAILVGWWQFKTTGIAITGNQLTIIYRIFSRVTFVVEKKRIQALEGKQSHFQKRKNLATIKTTVMSGMSGATAKAANLDTADAERVLKWFEKTISD